MKDNTIIVIGGGLAGLAAGCYALANGFDCTIVEQHHEAGGLAATWTRGDYIIDGGLFHLTGVQPGLAAYDLYRQLGILPRLRLTEAPVLLRVFDEALDRSLDVGRNLDRLAFELKAIASADEEHINDIAFGTKHIGLIDVQTAEMPLELMGARDKVRRSWSMRHTLRFFTGFYAQPVAGVLSKMKDQFVRNVLLGLTPPEAPLWHLVLRLSLFSRGQMALLPEGSISLVRLLEERFLGMGGTLRTGARVDQVRTVPLAEGGHEANGVVLESGETLEADYVVGAVDAYLMAHELLGGHFLDQAARARFRNWQVHPPLVMVSLGINRLFSELPPHNLLLLRRPLFVGDRTVDRLHLRLFNYCPSFAPAGKTVVQAWFESDWDHWSALARTDRSAYEAEKERMGREVVRRLEYHFPNVVRRVEMTDVATPYTTWRATGNLKGSGRGWLPTPQVAVATVPRTLPGLQGFFAAGHWTIPGGGAPAALLSGRHAVQLICHKGGRPFTPTAA